jgi:hypothetical protein
MEVVVLLAKGATAILFRKIPILGTLIKSTITLPMTSGSLLGQSFMKILWHFQGEEDFTGNIL